jgi:hypothetical protein
LSSGKEGLDGFLDSSGGSIILFSKWRVSEESFTSDINETNW